MRVQPPPSPTAFQQDSDSDQLSAGPFAAGVACSRIGCANVQGERCKDAYRLSWQAGKGTGESSRPAYSSRHKPRTRRKAH